ncbi:hypothetical protein FA15DRAFT_667127 [Coprinopsis marcescibilis]|uniref:Uncharacterized protein n=1 Tax=Coprinopsis marcescibilis TaxID=230819 RepID=A0A5C3L1Q4_COPMA|nr:hypothetical protein FA15DRAFT_667127 [Coprinopsis marcescibilis]
MPRPNPLQKFSSALSSNADYQVLTPRTPHSRTARAEEGESVFAKLQANANDFDDGVTYEQQQSAPLLHSSASGRFPAGLNPKEDDDAEKVRLSPLTKACGVFGVVLAGVLLVMAVVSWSSPGTLQRYLGFAAVDPAQMQAQSPEKVIVATASESHSESSFPAQATDHAQSPNPHGSNMQSISYANYTTFPLTPVQYLQECGKQMSGFMSHGDYWDVSPMGEMDVEHEDPPQTGTCKSTITYMLSGRVGLAADLALMAATAALARERNRTFLVEDSFWNRGKWKDHFQDVRIGQPGPEPDCRPPPAKEMVACPRTGRHWIVNSYTAKFHLGHTFEDHYENPFKHELNRQKEIFQASEESFRTTIRPNRETTRLINLAKQELARVFMAHLGDRDPTRGENTYFSVHVRRGDRIPQGWEYHRKPIPAQVYHDYINETAVRLYRDADDIRRTPVVYIASDSPESASELESMYKGPSFHLGKSSIQELKAIASDSEYRQNEFNELPAAKQFSLNKGAIVDLAMVTGLWDHSQSEPLMLDAAICAVSSTFCKLAAIGLGWDDAFGQVDDMGSIDNVRKRWVDLDTKGSELPVWRPFELF